jgi:hypothetical protein
MKVYIVQYPTDFFEEEEGGIYAVFTTEELAQEFIKKNAGESLFYEEYEVKDKL